MGATTQGLRLASVLPPAQEPAEREDRFFRSYADRLAEAGWIADTDYGFLGLERYLFAPGSPRPPAMSLDGFPVDLGWPAAGSLEGWGGEIRSGGRAWWPDPPSAPGPVGAVDLDRYPVGRGALLTRVTLHGEDLGGKDARVQFARRDEDAEWALSAGVRKETESFLLQEYRARGLAAHAARHTRWGSWRAAFLSSTSDVVYSAPDFSGDKIRRELVRLGLGAATRDSVVAVAAVLGSAGDGTGRSARQSLAVRVAPARLPLGAAVLATVTGRDVTGSTRTGLQLSLGRENWEAAGGLETGGGGRELRLRGSVVHASPLLRGGPDRVELGAEGSFRAGLGHPSPGAQRLSMLRLEPRLRLVLGDARLRVQPYLERDRGLDAEPPAPLYSSLLPAAVKEASSLGLELGLETPGPLRSRLGLSGLVQRTRDEYGLRLPFQPPYAAHAFVALDRRTPFVPMLAHLRLSMHAEGERRGESGLPSPSHVTLDFETVVDYGQLRLQVGFYNITSLIYDTTIAVRGRPTLAAVAPGRTMRFGITWDLWN